MNWKKYAFAPVLAALFSVPFLILSAHFLATIEEISKKDMLYYMDLRSSLTAAKISGILSSKYDVLKVIREQKFINASMEEKKKILSAAAAASGVVKEISLSDPSGKEIFSTVKKKNPEDYSSHPVFKNARYEDVSIGAVTYSADEPPMLSIAEPVIKNKGEKPVYVAMARLSLGELNRLLAPALEKTPGSAALVDWGGQIICDSSYDYLFSTGLYAPQPVVETIKKLAGQGVDSYKGYFYDKGEKKLFAVSRVPSTAWWFYEVLDESGSVDYYLYRWAKKTIYIGLVLIAVFSFLAYLLAVKWLGGHGHGKNSA